MILNNVASLFGVRFSTLFLFMKRETTDNRQEAFHQSMMLICSRMKYGLIIPRSVRFWLIITAH